MSSNKTRAEGKPELLLLFSAFESSYIYDALIDMLSVNELAFKVIFIGPAHSKFLHRLKSKPHLETFHLEAHKIQIFRGTTALLRFMKLKENSSIICFGQTASILGLFLGKLCRIKKRSYLRAHTSANRVEGTLRGTLYDWLCNAMSSEVLVPNENTKDYLRTIEKYRKKVTVINFGLPALPSRTEQRILEEKFRDELLIPKSQFLIGVVSRASKVKGLEYSLSAAVQILSERDDCSLIIVGAGSRESFYLSDVLLNARKEQVVWIDHLSEMSKFYSTVDCLVHVPIDKDVESFGLVYIEAFAYGIPCVITLSGIAKEIAIPGLNCLTVSYKNSIEIYNALKTLIQSKDLRSKIGLSAAKLEFSIEAMQENYKGYFMEFQR